MGSMYINVYVFYISRGEMFYNMTYFGYIALMRLVIQGSTVLGVSKGKKPSCSSREWKFGVSLTSN